MNRLMNGGRKQAKSSNAKWSRTTITVKGQDTRAYSNGGRMVVYKDGGGRFRVFDTKTGTTVTQGKGADLVFNKLADAKKYANR